MNKIFKVILLTLLTMTLCACGNAQDSSNNSDSTGNNKKEPTPVEITTDNWNEYFNLVNKEIKGYDEFGDFKCIYKVTALELKEEHTLSKTGMSELTVEITYDSDIHFYQLNEAKDDVIWLETDMLYRNKSDVIPYIYKDSEYERLFIIGGKTHTAYHISDEVREGIIVMSNVTISRVKGTIQLEK